MFVPTRERIQELIDRGLTQAEVARELGISQPTVCHHMRRLGHPAKPKRRYDWPAIRRCYDAGHTMRECQARFGFSGASWQDAIARGDITPRPRAMPIAQLLTAPRNRAHLKLRLLAAGLLAEECRRCGLSDWRGSPLALELHHINGRGQDNRLENLELLCPNCHSQTASWGGRNRGTALCDDERAAA
jgi:hypothetical protein